MGSLIVPRWYQEAAEYSIFDYFNGGNVGNPVVAMPTGTGKSVVIANFIKKVLSLWPNQRVMMLTHVKELIEQNAEKLIDVWPTAPLGIYSAGLNGRETILPIIFGGVQSVAPAIKRALAENDIRPNIYKHFGHRDLLLVDECHLISDKEASFYQYIIAELKEINPFLKVIGFTATPYRSKMGLITNNGIFTDICYDITDFNSFNRLIAEGFLSPLIAKPTVTEIDVSNVGIVGGEFNQKKLEAVSDDDKLVYSIVDEMVQKASDRNTWLVFATGIDNTEHMSHVIQSYGLEVLPVHSKLSKKVNDDRLRAYKAGELMGIVSGQKLTTGFDHPAIDFIGDANATLSHGKHVQKLGRGTRPSPATGKQNCLVLDFAANIKRLGPINDPYIPNKKSGKGGDAPVKICPTCGIYNHATAKHCENCGFEFTFESRLLQTSGNESPLRSDQQIVEYFDVKKVIYNLHEKRDGQGVLLKPPCIKVSYFCGLRMFSEFVMLEHGGYMAKRARDWWRQRHAEEPPPTTYMALQKVAELRMPPRIKVWMNSKKYPEILGVEW